MRKAIVKLLDGTIYEHEGQYIWGYKDELNDTRTDFIEIGKYTIRKKEILSIEIIDVEGEKENE